MVNVLRGNIDLPAVALAGAFVATVPGPLRVPFGLALCLFLPGYALVAALYPRTEALQWTERLALSIGSSIVVLVLVALAVSYSPWNDTPRATSIALIGVTIPGVLIGVLRRRRGGDRGPLLLDRQSCRSLLSWRIVTVILVAVCVAGISGYSLSRPTRSQAFTSFYVLRSNSTIGSYSSVTGRAGRLIVGITNREGRPVSYRVAASWSQGGMASVRTGIVRDGNTWRHALYLSRNGKNAGFIRLSLFRADRPRHIYRSLLLRIPARVTSW